jgi:hypothetical protein
VGQISFHWRRHFLRLSCQKPSPWSGGLRRRSAVARQQRLRVRIPPEAWVFVCCGCCVLSGRGNGDELISRPEESYRLWSVVVCDLETLWIRRPWPTRGCCTKRKKKKRGTRNEIFYFGKSVTGKSDKVQFPFAYFEYYDSCFFHVHAHVYASLMVNINIYFVNMILLKT